MHWSIKSCEHLDIRNPGSQLLSDFQNFFHIYKSYQVHQHNLKPANFLSVGGQLKVIDFGLAGEVLPGKRRATSIYFLRYLTTAGNQKCPKFMFSVVILLCQAGQRGKVISRVFGKSGS